MPLAHAILGFLEYQPMSGYDLKKYFDQSIAHFWSATQSHIYKALDTLEKDSLVESHFIPQEGRPNRKEYRITDMGRAELLRWITTPLPVEIPRQAWLIQIFFAHDASNEELVRLFEQRIANLRDYLSQCSAAQANIDANYQMLGVERLRELWQLTLDYGTAYYASEIEWLESTLPRLRQLPSLPDIE